MTPIYLRVLVEADGLHGYKLYLKENEVICHIIYTVKLEDKHLQLMCDWINWKVAP